MTRRSVMLMVRRLEARAAARPARAALAFLGFLLVGACVAGLEPNTPPREELSTLADASSRSNPSARYVDRFGGKLYLVLLDNKTHGSLRDGRSLWATSKTVTYATSDGSGVICVPRGFVTDFASVPRAFWTLLPPDGPWVKAAIIHDYLYYTRGSGVWKGHPRSITRSGDYTRAEADGILREAMQDRGVDMFRRNVIYVAVRVGGQQGWNNSPAPRPVDAAKSLCVIEADQR